MTLDWPWPILQQGLMWLLMFLYWEKMLESHLMKTYSKLSEWQKVYVKIKKSDPRGDVCPLSRGYIHVWNQAKIYIKSDFKGIFWNLQQMGKVTRPFSWHQNCFHKGLPFPAPGLCTCGKTLKNVYKIRIQRDFFLNSQQMVEVVRAFCWHQIFTLRVCLLLPRGYIHV